MTHLIEHMVREMCMTDLNKWIWLHAVHMQIYLESQVGTRYLAVSQICSHNLFRLLWKITQMINKNGHKGCDSEIHGITRDTGQKDLYGKTVNLNILRNCDFSWGSIQVKMNQGATVAPGETHFPMNQCKGCEWRPPSRALWQKQREPAKSSWREEGAVGWARQAPEDNWKDFGLKEMGNYWKLQGKE